MQLGGVVDPGVDDFRADTHSWVAIELAAELQTQTARNFLGCPAFRQPFSDPVHEPVETNPIGLVRASAAGLCLQMDLMT